MVIRVLSEFFFGMSANFNKLKAPALEVGWAWQAMNWRCNSVEFSSAVLLLINYAIIHF